MSEKKLNIVFMGTPEFAVASLDAIVEAGHNVKMVITAPDKASGRGLKIRKSAVKEYAEEKGLRISQPPNLKAQDFLDELYELKTDLIVVVAFRKMPKEVYAHPPMGTINLHGSLLPDYRGAAPINWAIINGEQVTGVTTFFVEEQIDHGKVIMRREVKIEPDDTAGDLYDKLMDVGSKALVETIDQIANNNVQAVEQNSMDESKAQLKKAPKIFRDDCAIDWKASALDIHNKVRGLSPFPGAHCRLTHIDGRELQVKVLKTSLLRIPNNPNKAVLKTDAKSYLKISCFGGDVDILRIQSAGKKAMQIEEWLRGSDVNNEWKVG